MKHTTWIVRSTPRADQDFAEILQWTNQTFGLRQARIYETTLLQALHALRDGSNILGSKPHDELDSGIRTLHVARNGRNGRHFILFRESNNNTIDVLRLLHDSMDLSNHLT